MQASKIVVGQIYAYKRAGGSHEIVRFKVAEVIQRRYQATGSPHDYKSEVLGRILEDLPKPDRYYGEGNYADTVKVDPKEILGPYEEHKHLVERAAREKAAKEAETRAKHEEALELRLVLYRLVGQDAPNDPSEMRQLFRVSSSQWNGSGSADVDMRAEATPLLLAALKALARP